MAQIRERLRKNGKKSFFVRIRMKRQPEVTASFDRLTDARIWASTTETAMREGRYIKTNEAQKHSLSDLVERYIIEVLPGKHKLEMSFFPN
jgi:hypothetical protein